MYTRKVALVSDSATLKKNTFAVYARSPMELRIQASGFLTFALRIYSFHEFAGIRQMFNRPGGLDKNRLTFFIQDTLAARAHLGFQIRIAKRVFRPAAITFIGPTFDRASVF